ncbi:MAG: serine protein kinase RIO [Acidilobaceae archaeon]|nr:serine protein kinase RIO [Acidilobaceae archaeon]MCX8165461.1 serine protein kinase RIO [Acidilobaceae archaeon]MDW7973888.1 serine protein kinase RIO [Sulfolobales archaeon]
MKLRRKVRHISREKERRLKDEDLFEVVEEVFDSLTMGIIYRLYNKGIIKDLKGVVSSGKEARVYWAKGEGGKDIAVKIYLVSTSDFRRSIKKYIEGDPRFESIPENNFRFLIYEWAKKEFRNLKRMKEAGVRVPSPIAVMGNVLVMEFLGEEGYRAPLLYEAEENLEHIYEDLMNQLRLMVCRAELVHADLSEYNVMVWRGEPWIIDVSQAVELSHPRALEFLRRDIENLSLFFSKKLGREFPQEFRGEVEECVMKA